jgi:exosome complex exonuclease RRP6
MLRRFFNRAVSAKIFRLLVGMDITIDFKAFQDKVQTSLVNVTKTAGQLSAEDLRFHRSSNGKLSRSLDAQDARLLQLTNKLLKAATKDTQVEAPKLRNQEEVEDKWRSTVDVIDDLLEKSDACLDEFTGIIKRLSPALQDGAATPPKVKENSQKVPSIHSTHVVPKPQLHFERPVANHGKAYFKPLLRSKPHAIVPLEERIGSGDSQRYVTECGNGYSLILPRYEHPYKTEIEQSAYPAAAYVSTEPIRFTPPTTNPAIFVDTEEAVRDMLEELRLAKEIAVDLEHHDSHSYIGIVCLMQISTRDKDWIVDTLKPWRENLQMLNEVFADPKIIKVFHGSHEDMIWLQRDLGLYVVGLFDTYYACVALNFEGRSLKYLLKRFADFDAQKKFQMADWRVRPLPTPLIDYARSDTHYLLYIYDNLRNMLLEASTPDSNLMDRICSESKKEALQRYERPFYDQETGLGSNGWYNALMRRSLKFDAPQFAVYRALHQWRDQLAREQDEGLPSIMTAAQLFAISEAMPMSVPSLMSSVRPITKAISDNARQLVEIIKIAKDTGAGGPSVVEILRRCAEKADADGIYRPNFSRGPRTIQNLGIGATVNMLLKEKEKEQEQGPVVRRSHGSTLWGSILSATATAEPALPDVAIDALRIVLPLPAKTDLSFVDASSAQPAQPIPFAATAHVPPTKGTYAAPELKDDVFVIRDLPRQQKRTADQALDTDDIPSVDPLSLDGNNSSPVTAAQIDAEIKAQQKAERRRLKKEQKAAAEQAKREALNLAVPFDYANAESVLHAKPGGQQKDMKSKKRPFDPNQKALDTSTGLKRARKEESGKSFTFKS